MDDSNKKNERAPLLGVVLAGGDSTRMGKDKSKIQYHSETQELFTARLLKGLTDKVIISKKKKEGEVNLPFEIIEDLFDDQGPLGAICSVQKAYPDYALLVLACDLPLVDNETIEQLIQARDPNKDLTAIKCKDREQPEPLLAIYEPSTRNTVQQYIESGYASPTRVLKNSRVNIIELKSSIHIFNANTPADEELARKHLINRKKT